MKITPVILVLVLVWISLPPHTSAETRERRDEFILARGDKLYEGDHEFRFISFNVPNLQLIEDNFAPGYNSPFIWPNEFEITDALESVRQMGGNVVRTYVLSVAREGSGMSDTVHVLGPGEFNEEAFRVLDLLLKIAREKGIRVIIPFVDHWHWMGGRAQYAGFRDKEPDDFWTDEEVISDFEQTIRFLMNRENTYTGVHYKDDPTIFAWETGNEISSPPEWTKRIAALIKSIDDKHLVIDGNSLHGVQAASLNDDNIDVLTTHHYPGQHDQPGKVMLAAIRQAREITRGKKPLFVGEFGFIPTDDVQAVLDYVIEDGISGALIWSLRFHHRDGGFYWHSETQGKDIYRAYHWPGFESGEAYDEKQLMELMRSKAFEIQAMEPPARKPPAAPRLLACEDVNAISWQGSAGAEDYDVWRATNENGPWELIGPGVVDAARQYVPLFQDSTAERGGEYYYRIAASNSSGVSPPSNVIGPIIVEHSAIVDECEDLSLAAAHQSVQPTSGKERNVREDNARLQLNPGGFLEYVVAEPISGWELIAFSEGEMSLPSVSSSPDGVTYTKCQFSRSGDAPTSADYGYLQHVELVGEDIPDGAHRLRIELPSDVDDALQLTRIVIRYGADQ